MSTFLTRRGFLASTAACAAASIVGGAASAATAARRLTLVKRTLEVRGKTANVFGLRGDNGRSGLVLEPGERFAVTVDNQIGEPTIIHWHGQTPPPDQDGVTDTGFAGPLGAGAMQPYDFAPRTGTHWMHSHHGLQEQQLMAAPLVVRSAADRTADRQEVIVLLHDFTFRDPAEILASLTGNMAGMDHSGMGGMAMGGMDHGSMPGMAMGGGTTADLNDIDYDAYLANDRTLDDPEVVRTEAGGRVLLRVINGATATAFWIDLGATEARLVAVDGNAVAPISGSRFPLVQGQRLDLELTVPAGAALPVLAQREGDRQRTGIILAAIGAPVTRIADAADAVAPAVDLSLEARLTALDPPQARAADVTHAVTLAGAMMPYVWTIDGASWAHHRPLMVRQGQRAVLEITNRSAMAHPMHLHGHHFQVISIDGRPLAGAVRDTVLVPAMGHVAVAFDADNPGRWLFHCHNLYHMATGMMTEVAYETA